MGSKIFWAVIGGFLLGVYARSFLPLGFAYVWFALVLATSCIALGYIERARFGAFLVVAAILVSFAAGMARMHLAVQNGDLVLNGVIGRHVVIEGVIAKEPDARETSTLVSVSATGLVGSSTIPVSAGVIASVPAHTSVHYGDVVRLSGTLRLPEAFDTTAGRQFNYPYYLAAQGIQYQLSLARLNDTGKNEANSFLAAAYEVKGAFVRGIDMVLPEPEAGLAAGITVGDKRSVGQELSADFQRDSLVHMIVLSGYNITVVLNAIAVMLSRLPRSVGFGGAILGVLFFALISGGASSAIRAGLMALIAVAARMTHRTYLGERALGVSAFLMVLYNPFTLAFDPSFQLSALATLGLILFTPLFAEWFARVPVRFGLREIISSTCATQLMVLPLLLYQNGTLSLVALPANLLALLPVPFAMLFSFIAALGGIALGSYAVPLAFPAHVLLWYIIAVARSFAALPFAAVSLPAFSAWWVAGAYAAMFGGYWMLQTSGRPEGAAAEKT